MRLLMIIFSSRLVFGCYNQYSSPPKLQESTSSAPSVYSRTALDSVIITVNNELRYGLFVYSDNTYLLKVNNSDSVAIGLFEWENAHSKGLVFQDMHTSLFLKFSKNLYFLCIPYDMGDYKLIGVYREKDMFKIDKNEDNWIYTQAKYIVIPKSNDIAVPITRRADAEKVYYWTYKKNLKKWKLRKKKLIEYDPPGDYFYRADDPAYVKKVISGS